MADLSNLEALGWLNLSDNKGITGVDLSGNTAMWGLFAHNTGLTALDVSGNAGLKTLYVNGNAGLRTPNTGDIANLETVNVDGAALPLSQLHPLVRADNVHFGTQNNVVVGDTAALRSGVAYGLSAESRFDGKATRFTIRRADGHSVAVEGTDDTVADGVVTFLVPGAYTIAMENDAIYSKGAWSIRWTKRRARGPWTSITTRRGTRWPRSTRRR